MKKRLLILAIVALALVIAGSMIYTHSISAGPSAAIAADKTVEKDCAKNCPNAKSGCCDKAKETKPDCCDKAKESKPGCCDKAKETKPPCCDKKAPAESDKK